MNTLSIQHLSCGYKEQVILRDISLNVEAGKTCVIMGPSGIGKSTLLLTILGILPPIQGTILLSQTQLNPLCIEQRHIGYLPQDYGLFPHLSVLDNIAFGLKIKGICIQQQHQIALDLMHKMDLRGLESRKPSQLSGGQRQRVGLARALAIQPQLLLLDEPLSNIDPITKSEVGRSLKNLFKSFQIPILLVTHNHEDVHLFADFVVVLNEGKIEQTGSLQELLDHPKTDFVRKILKPFSS